MPCRPRCWRSAWRMPEFLEEIPWRRISMKTSDVWWNMLKFFEVCWKLCWRIRWWTWCPTTPWSKPMCDIIFLIKPAPCCPQCARASSLSWQPPKTSLLEKRNFRNNWFLLFFGGFFEAYLAYSSNPRCLVQSQVFFSLRSRSCTYAQHRDISRAYQCPLEIWKGPQQDSGLKCIASCFCECDERT